MLRVAQLHFGGFGVVWRFVIKNSWALACVKVIERQSWKNKVFYKSVDPLEAELLLTEHPATSGWPHEEPVHHAGAPCEWPSAKSRGKNEKRFWTSDIWHHSWLVQNQHIWRFLMKKNNPNNKIQHHLRFPSSQASDRGSAMRCDTWVSKWQMAWSFSITIRSLPTPSGCEVRLWGKGLRGKLWGVNESGEVSFVQNKIYENGDSFSYACECLRA